MLYAGMSKIGIIREHASDIDLKKALILLAYFPRYIFIIYDLFPGPKDQYNVIYVKKE